MEYKYCPHCGCQLQGSAAGRPACVSGCGAFVHWHNPVPVVAALLPVVGRHGGADSIVLVQRGIEPCKGGWCFPGGYVDSYEDPQTAIIREVKEETGLLIRLERILLTSAPVNELGGNPPLNQLLIVYLAQALQQRELDLARAGDDAVSVGHFSAAQLPELCFPTQNQIESFLFKPAPGSSQIAPPRLGPSVSCLTPRA